MMPIINSILLGILQGLTEFLPISSSAHLVFAEQILKLDPNLRMSYNTFLHFGTTFALLLFFVKRIIQLISSIFPQKSSLRQNNLILLFYIIIGSIPVAIIGLLFKTKIELTFAQPIYPAIFLIITGILLFTTKLVKPQTQKLNLKIATIIGVTQAAALLPGISRSGATIAIALLLGVSSFEAFEFSFLLSIPAVIGANLLTMKDFTNFNIPNSTIIFGTIAAFTTGLFALFLLRYLVLRKRIYYFSFYCLALAIMVLILN